MCFPKFHNLKSHTAHNGDALYVVVLTLARAVDCKAFECQIAKSMNAHNQINGKGILGSQGLFEDTSPGACFKVNSDLDGFLHA